MKFPYLHIKSLDRDHMDLFLLLAQVKTEMDNLGKIYELFQDHVVAHARREEVYMEKVGYPRDRIYLHTQDHYKIQTTFLGLNFNDSSEYNRQQLDFMRDTFLQHITDFDLSLSTWLFEESKKEI